MIENIVFDYGGVLVQYDFVAFFGKLLGSRERGQWFMDHVLPEEVGAAMDRELHPFDYYIRQPVTTPMSSPWRHPVSATSSNS